MEWMDAWIDWLIMGHQISVNSRDHLLDLLQRRSLPNLLLQVIPWFFGTESIPLTAGHPHLPFSFYISQYRNLLKGASSLHHGTKYGNIWASRMNVGLIYSGFHSLVRCALRSFSLPGTLCCIASFWFSFRIPCQPSHSTCNPTPFGLCSPSGAPNHNFGSRADQDILFSLAFRRLRFPPEPAGHPKDNQACYPLHSSLDDSGHPPDHCQTPPDSPLGHCRHSDGLR